MWAWHNSVPACIGFRFTPCLIYKTFPTRTNHNLAQEHNMSKGAFSLRKFYYLFFPWGVGFNRIGWLKTKCLTVQNMLEMSTIVNLMLRDVHLDQDYTPTHLTCRHVWKVKLDRTTPYNKHNNLNPSNRPIITTISWARANPPLQNQRSEFHYFKRLIPYNSDSSHPNHPSKYNFS